MQSRDDGSYFIMLKRTFNPAGVPNSNDRASILLNCYVPQEKREIARGENKGSQNQPDQSNYARQSSPSDFSRNLDDEVPF